MDIANLLNTSLGNSLGSIFTNKNKQEEQENTSATGLSYSVSSDRVNISQEAMQLVANSESSGQDQGGNGAAGGRGGNGTTDSESKVQELQSKLQGLLSRLAAAMQQGNEAEAGGIHGQISTVMAQISALQASGG